MSFFRCLGGIVSSLDLPFGYTLTIWSSGAIAASRFGFPSLFEIFVFLISAVSAYLICVALFFRSLEEAVAFRLETIALINVFSVVAAAAVSVVSLFFNNPALGYLVAGFVGTLSYILCMSGLLCVAGFISRNRTSAE